MNVPTDMAGLDTCGAAIDFSAALAILKAEATVLGIETVRLAEAGRRVLAEDVRGQVDAPREDVAAMDGYAVRNADLKAGVRIFAAAGTSYPGATFAGKLGTASAVRIMTGAPMPSGLDRVLPIECVQECDGMVSLFGELPHRPHVRRRASDITAGASVLKAGQIIDTRTMLVAAAADVATLTVWVRPRAFVLTLGDELVEPGAAASTPRSIPDSLSEALNLFCRQWGAKPSGINLVPDDAARIGETAASRIGDTDILIMAGGASRGDRDFARSALTSLGLDLRFAGVAMKPGKPAWYGRIGRCHVVGLPGNPTAALTVARVLLVPLIMGLSGRSVDAGLRWRDAPLASPAPEVGRREEFLCGEWDGSSVSILERQEASSQLILAKANVLVRRPALAPALPAGHTVQLLPF